MTNTRFYCAICGAGLTVAAGSAGRVIECPDCRHVVPVPAAIPQTSGVVGGLPLLPAEILALDIKFLCSECGAKLSIDARLEGASATCPKCTQTIQVPRWSKPPSEVRPRVAGQSAQLSTAEIEFLSEPPERSGARTAAG